jgi:hypothetical protein
MKCLLCSNLIALTLTFETVAESTEPKEQPKEQQYNIGDISEVVFSTWNKSLDYSIKLKKLCAVFADANRDNEFIKDSNSRFENTSFKRNKLATEENTSIMQTKNREMLLLKAHLEQLESHPDISEKKKYFHDMNKKLFEMNKLCLRMNTDNDQYKKNLISALSTTEEKKDNKEDNIVSKLNIFRSAFYNINCISEISKADILLLHSCHKCENWYNYLSSSIRKLNLDDKDIDIHNKNVAEYRYPVKIANKRAKEIEKKYEII